MAVHVNPLKDFEQRAEPTAVCAYFDVIRFWLKNPLDHRARSELQHLTGVKLRIDTEPARFSASYRQRINLWQPSDRALDWLAEHLDHILINYLEMALDWTFKDGDSRDEGRQFIDYYFVRRHHGKTQKIKFYEQTRYDGARSARNRTVLYNEEVSRKTGEMAPSLHLEWRANGAQAVRSLGIVSAADLVRFDHRRFWELVCYCFTRHPVASGGSSAIVKPENEVVMKFLLIGVSETRY
jgi:hypothetical protein